MNAQPFTSRPIGRTMHVVRVADGAWHGAAFARLAEAMPVVRADEAALALFEGIESRRMGSSLELAR
jgi:hypothetical protein